MKNFENVVKASHIARADGARVTELPNSLTITGFAFQVQDFFKACRDNGFELKDETITRSIPTFKYFDGTYHILVYLL